MGIFGFYDNSADDLYHETLLQQQRQRNQQVIADTLDLQLHHRMQEERDAASQRKKRIYTEIELRKAKEQIAALQREADTYRNIAISVTAHRRAYRNLLIELEKQGKLPFTINQSHDMTDAAQAKIEADPEHIAHIAKWVDKVQGEGYKPKTPFPAKV